MTFKMREPHKPRFWAKFTWADDYWKASLEFWYRWRGVDYWMLFFLPPWKG